MNPLIMKECYPLKSLVIILFLSGLIAGGCASTKKAVPSFVGSWDYTAYDTPEGDMNGVFIINQVKGRYKGKIRMRGIGIEMQDLKIEDNKISCFIMVQGYKVDFNGEFDGNNFSGHSSLDDSQFKIKAIKAN